MALEHIKHIIFDLGRVVIHLNEEDTTQAFKQLGAVEEEDLERLYDELSFFHEFERGEIDEQEFRDFLKTGLREESVTDEQINAAWNAMLKGIDVQLIDQIKSVALERQVYVLSNTNIIHERAFNDMLLESTGHPDLHGIFHKVYFSHEIGMRKPELRSWEIILDEQAIDSPSNVLFLDDRADNVAAARSLGIQSMLIEDPHHTSQILSEMWN